MNKLHFKMVNDFQCLQIQPVGTRFWKFCASVATKFHPYLNDPLFKGCGDRKDALRNFISTDW